MKILITGGAGFIGSNLAKRLLLNNENQVTALDNLSYGQMRNVNSINDSNFEFIQGDLGNPFVLRNKKFDVIVHLASQKIPRYTSAFQTLEENNIMLKNVILKCLEDGSKIVFASTSDVYGKNPDVPFSEESNIVLGSSTVKRWAYATSKIYGEHLIRAYHDEFGLDFSITRFFGSYGAGQNLSWWGGPQSVFIEKALKNETIEIHGTGLQTRTFTYIKDTVEALQHLVLDPKSNGEIYNIAGDPKGETTILNLANIIWRLVNGENSEPKLNLIPYETFGKYEDVMRRVPNIDKITSQFDYEPQYDLETGLIETIQWQKTVMGL